MKIAAWTLVFAFVAMGAFAEALTSPSTITGDNAGNPDMRVTNPTAPALFTRFQADWGAAGLNNSTDGASLIFQVTSNAATWQTFAGKDLTRSVFVAANGRSLSFGTNSAGAPFNLYAARQVGNPAIEITNDFVGNTTTLNAGNNLVKVNGELQCNVLQINGADFSEKFAVSGTTEPGSVVCIDAANPGALTLSSKAYDHTVAGIISGANGVRTGMIMGQAGSVASGDHAVAMSGRVYCKVDATSAAVEPGDLLTTSDTPGHAMKVSDHSMAPGAVIGKAMTPLAKGEKGLVLVLVSLQ